MLLWEISSYFFYFFLVPATISASSKNILFKSEIGFSPLKFTVGGDTYKNEPLGVGATFNIKIDYLLESIFSNLGLYYKTIIGSDYGLVPLNEVGLSFTYFPYDFIKEKIIIDNQVSMSVKKVLPFISIDVGACSFSVNDTKQTETSFNSILMDLSVFFGVMFPYRGSTYFTSSVGYSMSYGGASKIGSDGQELPSIGFKSAVLMIGFAYNP